MRKGASYRYETRRNHLGRLTLSLAAILSASADPIIVGSKKFTESYVLGEIAKRSLESAGITSNIARDGRHDHSLGGAARRPDRCLSGIHRHDREEILKNRAVTSLDELRDALAKFGVGMSSDLGFNNTYALVMRRERSGAAWHSHHQRSATASGTESSA